MGRCYLDLKQIQQEEYKILCSSVDYFEANDISYSLAYGTLLGAVRHGGFIPWDDDVDLFIPRSSYVKLLGMKDDFHEKTGLSIVSIRGLPEDISPIVKVVDPHIVATERGAVSVGNLWVDLFPIDGLPLNDEGKTVAVCRKATFLNYLFAAKTSPVSSALGIKRKVVKAIIKGLFFWKSPEAIARSIKKNAERCSLIEGCQAANLTFAVLSNSSRFVFTDPSCWKSMTFEGRQFTVFDNWDHFLEGTYGDYMTPPPEGNRDPHSLIAWVESECASASGKSV